MEFYSQNNQIFFQQTRKIRFQCDFFWLSEDIGQGRTRNAVIYYCTPGNYHTSY